MIITYPDFMPANVSYGFFTKQLSGVEHNYSLQDSQKAAMDYIGCKGQLSILKQIHSNKVIHVTKDNLWQVGQEPEADAMITTEPGIMLGILTADCVPIIFVAEDNNIVGAAHSGWRGARHGIIENTAEMMRALGAENITAIIGACIRQPSYEVGPEFFDNFLAEDAQHSRFFIPSTRPEHHLFDLPGYVKFKLHNCGVSQIFDINRDTLQEPELFWSYRRATLQKGTETKRSLLSVVGLR
jgi:hypothetical protein